MDMDYKLCKQILKQAMDKAIKNGWKNPHPNIIWLQYYYNDIFSHNFAKAFFKDTLHGWEWHIQQMVLEKEPLKYLAKFL